MCGRYVSTRGPAELSSLFHVPDPPLEEVALEPSWNVAPTDDVWAVMERVDRDTGEIRRQLRAVRWGLVPSWAKSPDVGPKMINARVETVADKPAFRRPFAKRRCLLPADGFYEWQSVDVPGQAKPRKQPYFITPEDGSVMALAGLYEFWRDPGAGDQDQAAWWTTCTIITTEARDAAGRIHPRMPLALPADHYDSWLDPAHEDAHELRDLLITPAAGHLVARPVSSAVNSVRNDGPQLVEEVPPESGPEQGRH
jgi:putative SOS response-associated peptidase YedK